MKLTNRAKWGLATVAIPVLAAASLYIYAIWPEDLFPPPETGVVREVPSSWFDRAISAWYEKKTDEPIVAIIRQDIQAEIGAISPDGKYIATGGSHIRDVAISSIAEKRIIRKLAINSCSIHAIAFSPDGRYLATGRGFMGVMPHNESVNIWDAQSGKLIRNLPGPAGPKMILNNVTGLTFSPDSQLLAVSYIKQPNNGNSIRVFDVETGERVQVMHPSGSTDGPIVFLDGGKYLGYENDGFNVHEVHTGKRVQQFSQHGVYALSPDGQYLATRSNTEQNLKILDRHTGREVKVLGAAEGPFRILAYSPDGQHLAEASNNGLVIWDISTGKVARKLTGLPHIVSHWIGFDDGGKYFAAVCNKYVVVWDFKKLIPARPEN
jgi:WD40 repeat protein